MKLWIKQKYTFGIYIDCDSEWGEVLTDTSVTLELELNTHHLTSDKQQTYWRIFLWGTYLYNFLWPDHAMPQVPDP